MNLNMNCEVKIEIVGKKFRPGEEANQWIAQRLGIQGSTPDYQTTEGLAIEEVGKRSERFYAGSTRSGDYVVVFARNGVVYVTAGSPTLEVAATIALSFLLLDDN